MPQRAVAGSCRHVIRTAVAACIVLGAGAVGEAHAATTVTGQTSTNAALVITPDTSPVTSDDLNLYTGETVFYIQKMPSRRLINRVTVGKLARGSSCTSNVSVRMTISEKPTGRWDGVTGWSVNSYPATLTSTLSNVVFKFSSLTLVEDRAYSFSIANLGGCVEGKRTTWAHNAAQVNPGPANCTLVLQISPLDYRMYHAGGTDAVPCPGSSIPSGFDPSMPPGWLMVRNTFGTPYVYAMTAPIGTTPNCPEGRTAVLWRDTPGDPTQRDYVCTYVDFAGTPGTSVADGWYYAGPWYKGRSGPQDMYLKLELNQPEVAAAFQPVLRFDSSERWRPLNVDSFLTEKVTGTTSPLHDVCENYLGSTNCLPLDGASSLSSFNSTNGFLDLHVHAADNDTDEDTYKSPDPTCVNLSIPQWDCNGSSSSGGSAKSAQYYRVTNAKTAPYTGPYRYVDYWYFYRFNGVPDAADWFAPEDLDHEGDWESVTIAPSATTPETFDFASFSQHSTWASYLRPTLECDELYPAYCGTDDAKSGRRIRVYVADGTHANYPYSCSKNLPTDCQQDISIYPDMGHNGAIRWGGDDDPTSLKTFSTTWNTWLGRWGDVNNTNLSDGPQSPGKHTHWTQYWQSSCADNNAGCPRDPQASTNRSSRSDGNADCERWFGAFVSALICSPPRLRGALARRAMGKPGPVSISFGKRDARASAAFRKGGPVSASAPGVAQAVSEPLRPGQRLYLRSRRSVTTDFAIRTRDRNELLETRFEGVRLRRGRTPVTVVNHRGHPVPLIKSRRRTLRPTNVRSGQTVPPRPPKLVSVTRVGDRIVVTFVSRAYSTAIALLRTRHGRELRSKVVRRARGRTTIGLRPVGAKYIGLAARGRRGPTSRAVIVKLR